MAASEAAVAAVMKAMGCARSPERLRVVRDVCLRHYVAQVGRLGEPGDTEETTWTDRGCPVAVAAADAAVDADRASIQAQALRGYANELDGKRPEECPCATPEACCESEESCDAMQPVTRVVGAINLRARADRIEGKP